MKRRSLVRWACTVLATGLCLSLVGLWVASGWRWFFLSDGRGVTCHIDRGAVTLAFERWRNATWFMYGENGGGALPQFSRGDGWKATATSRRGPLIDVIAVALALTLLLWLW